LGEPSTLALWATLMPLGIARAMRRQASRLAPPGAVLGVGFGESAVALQTGSERKTAAYTSIKTARAHRGFMVLAVGNRYAFTALPAHLFSATLPQDLARFHRGSQPARNQAPGSRRETSRLPAPPSWDDL